MRAAEYSVVLKTEEGTEIKREAGTFLTVTTVQRQEERGAPSWVSLGSIKLLHEQIHIYLHTPFRL